MPYAGLYCDVGTLGVVFRLQVRFLLSGVFRRYVGCWVRKHVCMLCHTFFFLLEVGVVFVWRCCVVCCFVFRMHMSCVSQACGRYAFVCCCSFRMCVDSVCVYRLSVLSDTGRLSLCM